jgi:hypothetical protein
MYVLNLLAHPAVLLAHLSGVCTVVNAGSLCTSTQIETGTFFFCRKVPVNRKKEGPSNSKESSFVTYLVWLNRYYSLYYYTVWCWQNLYLQKKEELVTTMMAFGFWRDDDDD